LSQPQPTLSQYLDVLRRQAWLIAAVAVVAAATAAVVSLSRESVYRASMQVVVGQGGGVFEAQFGSAVEPFTQTMTNLLKSNIVAERVVENLNLDTTPEQLLKHIHVSTRPQSSVLVVNYDAPLSDQPERVVRELGEVFTTLVDEKLGAGRATTGNAALPVITATVFDPSHLEADRVSPQPVRNIAFAGLIGLVLGLILGIARDSTDVRIRGKADAEEWFGAPVTGTLPKGLRGKPPFGLADRPVPRDPAFANALQLLRANLEFSSLKGPTIVITSALPEEGKSTVAANLSVALASAGNDVICVECDVRKPRIHEYLGLRPTQGFVDVLELRTTLDEALQTVPLRTTTARPDAVGQGRLRVLLSGTRPTEPMLTQLFVSERIDELLKALGKRAKYVIFDTPPMLLVGDAFPLLTRADSVLVVAREGRTRKESAQAVRATLQALGTEAVSVILTDARATTGYGYGYRYGYGEERLSAV
jgi:succinoglycan biosynthesis transport protein ExoP